MNFKLFMTSCLMAGLVATPVKADNLLQIYRLAVDNDPVFLSAGAQLEANLENENQSLASLLPNLSGSYSMSYNKNSSETGPGTATYGESEGNSLGISLRQSIYDYSTWVGYDQAQKRTEQARVQYRSSEQELIVRVTQRYMDVLSAQDNLEFAEATQKAIQQQLEQTKQRYEVGLIAITDVHEAQADFDQSVADRIAAQNRLDNANEALREVTGRYHESLGMLKDDIPLSSPEPARIDDWVQVARESNLNVISSNMELYIAKQDVKRRFGGHLPSIDLSASYSDSETDPAGFDINTESYGLSGGVTVSIPLYSGGRTHSTVKQGQALLKKAEFDLESAMRGTVRNTRSAYLNVEASIASITALKQSVVSQESALEATQAGFEVGTRTIVDVLNSTRALFRARSQLASARYNYVLAILQLKQAAGILTVDDLEIVNRWIENPAP
jgi:outer membrane protein